MNRAFEDQFVIPCRDMPDAVAAMKSIGFRLELILPAENPTTAVFSKKTCVLRLEQTPRGFAIDSLVQRLNSADPSDDLKKYNFTKRKFELKRTDVGVTDSRMIVSGLDGSYDRTEGRAGMLYRNLLPDRNGSDFVASHIEITKGGPVDDYVHYHQVDFQMIYCLYGWVKVVYENQGEPFVLNAGDCVLQPPQIRHRVLESSDNLEVIEVSGPAIHPTLVDHTITLPNNHLDTSRSFGGQRFVRFISEENEYRPYKGFLSKDTGIGEATNGTADVRLLKCTSKIDLEKIHSSRFYFIYILAGDIEINGGEVLSEDCAVSLPPNEVFRFKFSSECEFLEIRIM